MSTETTKIISCHKRRVDFYWNEDKTKVIAYPNPSGRWLMYLDDSNEDDVALQPVPFTGDMTKEIVFKKQWQYRSKHDQIWKDCSDEEAAAMQHLARFELQQIDI